MRERVYIDCKLYKVYTTYRQSAKEIIENKCTKASSQKTNNSTVLLKFTKDH